MGEEVVYDKVDFLAGGLCGDDFLEKADELLAGVAPGSASDELAASGLQGGIKGEGAVTEILKPMRHDIWTSVTRFVQLSAA